MKLKCCQRGTVSGVTRRAEWMAFEVHIRGARKPWADPHDKVFVYANKPGIEEVMHVLPQG